MRENTKIENLRQIIYKELVELAECQYALFDLPYHTNIGDGLIWEGEKQFLKEMMANCVHASSYFTCHWPKLETDVKVLIHGGGNFGDLYREHFDFVKKVIEHYPNNRIVFFPQTIYYVNEEVLKSDMELINSHGNVLVCARDAKSYDLIRPYLNMGGVKLVPDMAFCISIPALALPQTNRGLAIIRRDGELNGKTFSYLKNLKVEKKDWPTFYHRPFDGTFVFKVLAKFAHWNVWGSKSLLNVYCRRFFSANLLNIGLKFYKGYSEIYTTRLHGCILAILTGRKCWLLDNNYGKNSTFYFTWLKDFENIEYVKL